MIQKTDRMNGWHQTHFDLLEKSLNGEAQSRIHGVRREAIARFDQLGFPTTRNEEWRFTNVSPIASTEFKPVFAAEGAPVSAGDVARFSFGGLRCARLVFVNGHFSPSLSFTNLLPKGARAGSLAVALETDADFIHEHLTRYARYENEPFIALNTAFVQDGAFIQIPDRMILDIPIHIIFISTGDEVPFVTHPRNLIISGESSQLSIAESYVSLGEPTYLTNAVTEIVVGENAVVEHDKLQTESQKAFHIGTVHVYQMASSNYTSNSISLGGSLTRNNITSVLDAQGIECTLNGLSLATSDQHVDNHTTIDHAKPHCVSHELYKSILDGQARGVFNGKIFVRKDAQKTDAKQSNKTLLLSDQAQIDTKPQLEIFADDVKCTHGATVGQLNQEQLFYLRSRGIAVDDARDMLTFAFVSDIINKVHVEPLRLQLDQMLHARLRQGRVTKL